MKNLSFQPPSWKKLQLIKNFPSAVGMASNFGHRSRSRRCKIFGYGRRTSAFGPTLRIWLLLHEINRWRHNVFQFGEWHWKNSNWLLSEIKRERWKIILPSTGLELTTPGLWVRRSTNWATGEIYNKMENRIVLKIFLQLCYQFVSDQRGCGPSCHLFRALEPT